MKNARNIKIFSNEFPKEMSQGVIFNCAIAEDYPSCDVFGIIITARCDIAWKKAKKYNYLPIVKLSDWIRFDGRILLCEIAKRKNRDTMVSCLKNIEKSPSLLEVLDPNEISTIIQKDAKPRDKKNIAKFATCAEIDNYISTIFDYSDKQQADILIKDNFDKILNSLLIDLFNHKILGYYFIESIGMSNSSKGYVVLLREIKHLNSNIAEKIIKGIDKSTYQLLVEKFPNSEGQLMLSDSSFVMPISTLESPFLEHLMQTFTFLFSRIGLPDLFDQYVKYAIDHAISDLGEQK